MKKRTTTGSYKKGNSNTGYIGITRTHITKNGRQYPCITVSARPKVNQVMATKFYFDPSSKRSYEEAIKKAIAWRAEKLAKRNA